MTHGTDAVVPGGLVDLASERVGGRALHATDEFFAPKENLLRPGRGVFIPDRYTDRGKWMDGWESRRSRAEGHDECIVRLGLRGTVRAVDIDTNHFLGNHPPYASMDACDLGGDPEVVDLCAPSAPWRPLVPLSSLRPGSQNLFVVQGPLAATHVRLRIYPDGGVARLRVYGDVLTVASRRRPGRPIDLAALANGGRAIAANDMFFSPMDNLIGPGRSRSMADGWETRRKRVPGHDWVVLRLGLRGRLVTIEVQTHHFKGNHPDRCSLEACDLPGGLPDPYWDRLTWTPVLGPVKLGPDRRHVFRKEVRAAGPFTHVRFNIFPDGGVSRLRLLGFPMED